MISIKNIAFCWFCHRRCVPMVLQHRIHLVSRYPHSAVGCAAAAVSTYYCATIKKRKKTGHALEDTKHSMLLCTWRHISFSFGDIPPFKHENICQSIILSLSLFSAIIIIIIEKKRKSVGRVFRKYQCCWYLKIKRWRDINISLSMYLRPYSMLVAQHKVIGHAQTVLVFRRTITCRLSCQ